MGIHELVSKHGLPIDIDIYGETYNTALDKMRPNGLLRRTILEKLPNGNWLFRNPITFQVYESMGDPIRPLEVFLAA